jgi:rhamnogalacturonan endolyase
MRKDPARDCTVVVAARKTAPWRWQLVIKFTALLGAAAIATSARAQDESNAPAVAVEEDQSSFALSNGIITIRVSKRSGDLTSMQYKGQETLTDKSGHAGGYWSHDTTGGKETIARVTIDPRATGGNRGEVCVKAISGGLKMGHGPGAAAGGDFPADIEIRYCLGRGESGVYTYCTFEHKSGYPAASMTEARYCAKLADMFDWMTLDAKRNMHFPANLREGDKYIYTAVQFEHPVYGWSSTTKNIGFWLINPSLEYLSGGPTKVEFLCHRDTTQIAAPCMLNYWRSSHYGGAVVSVAEDEHWTKVVGPFFLYLNSDSGPEAMWKDAQGQAAREAAKWPYEWVAGIDFPRPAERATVRGQLVLSDPQMPGAKTPNLLVGLTHAVYTPPVTRPGGLGPPRPIDWQTDAKHYEFWVRGDDQGNFTIPNVRPGKYTLHALCDAVLGEFSQADITVEPTQSLELGKQPWTPVRRGKQIWEIGIPNRNGSEFFHGEDYADPEISLKYATLFPNDVNYVIGKSDFRRDWFFQHVPHNEDPNARAVPFFGIRGNGRATPYAITFDLPEAPRGKATLRLAICGTSARTIEVTVNDQTAGQIDRLISDGAIPRHSIQGIWYERELPFDASLMTQGTNVLKLVVPAGPINNGIIYYYVRLELDEPNPVPAKPAPVKNDPPKSNTAAAAPPTIFIAGDSTAANGIPGAIGWGKHLEELFDDAKIKVVNMARGGRSSRTFVTEGHWDRLLAELKTGDFVLIQFGHNDGAAINTYRLARGSLPGLSDESQEIDNLVTGQHELVHTFGWYLHKMIADATTKGARPILFSLTVRNIWKDGHVERGSGRYGEWTRELAKTENVPFVDLTRLVADRYEQMGSETVNGLFPRDHTHTSEDGAKLNASLVVSGLKGLRDQSLFRCLSAAGRAIPTADPTAVSVARQPPRRGGEPADFQRWLNLPEPGDPALRSLFLVGDSTVRNGRGDGYDGQFGWGDPLAAAFDSAKINVVNRAIGGTGARSFMTQGHWDRVLSLVKPGDFILMQFGHNDNGPRGPLRGVGDETEERQIPLTNKPETVHSFGWYLRKYIADTNAKGATPIVCSLVPRNIWRDGQIARPRDGHADWARAVAQAEQSAFLDLHETIATRYDALGEEAVGKLFADARVHTTWEGAVLSAQCVVASIKNLPQHPLIGFLAGPGSPTAHFVAQETAARSRSIADGPDPREIPVPPIIGPLGKLPGPSELPTCAEMPDVLTMNDGTKVTTQEQWKRRREEMKRTLAYYALGQIPPPPGNVKGQEVKSEVVADGKVKYRLIRLTFGPEERLGLDIGIFTPSEGGPFPSVILPSGTPPGATPLPRLPNGPNQGRGQNVLLLVGPAPASETNAAQEVKAAPVSGQQLPAAPPPGGRGGFGGPVTAESIATRNQELFRRNYALVTFNNNDCAEDTTLRNLDGSWAFRNTRFYPAYPGYDWGILAGWAWGASRIADYLETDPAIDKTRLIITGASRAGKAAMVAAAFDERLMGAPVVTGGGGIGAYRFSGIGRGGKEGLGEMMNKYPNWFSPNLHEFWGQTEKLPFDAHWFLALCAPRPFIALEGDTDTVSLPNAVRHSILAARPAYEFVGAVDRLGVNYAKHGHAFTQDDWNAMLDFADKHLRGMKVDRSFDQFLPESQADATQPR